MHESNFWKSGANKGLFFLLFADYEGERMERLPRCEVYEPPAEPHEALGGNGYL